MTLLLAAEPMITLEEILDAGTCDCIDETTDPVLVDDWIDAASDIVASVTGMRVAGQLAVVARPCREGFLCSAVCACGCGLDSIPLGEPKPTITAVKINGAVVPATDYELHWDFNGWNLARLGDGITAPRPWPSYQDRWRADTENHTFAIYMTLGIPIDSVLIRNAMLEVVCRLASIAAAGGASNSLERGIVSAQLGGTTVQVDQDDDDAVPAEVGPRLGELIGILSPQGRETTAVYAPELAMGWTLNLRPVPVVGS